jgi:ABC-type nitrate/sulfonate/bicarbonate transport system substrate-binding protein
MAKVSLSMTDPNTPPRSDALAWVVGSDAPEKHVVNPGFMALTDAASVIVAAIQGFAQPRGLLSLRRQHSWSSLRDKLAEGGLAAAQGLYRLIYAMHSGIGGGGYRHARPSLKGRRPCFASS